MKTKGKTMNWKLMSITLFGFLIVTLVVLGMVLLEPQGYTVVMSNCDESFALLGGHVASFADLSEAKEWADTMLGVRYDMASIYELDSPNRLTELLWLKSETCYDGAYSDWADVQSD